jgi:hypothetical protein
MKRIGITCLAYSAVMLAAAVGTGFATPTINGASIATRTFNDCPLSTLTTINNYPTQIQITDVMDTLCVGFANLHSFSFSADGGATAAAFNNDDNFHIAADFKIDGAGQGEGGLRLSPWYGQFVDGRFMANATTGEIACFGGALPFYSFTVNHGITYTRGTTIHLELTYVAHNLIATDPATIQYRVVYNGNTYDSPVLPFGEQNEAECVHGLWGMLNDGRVGGYFQPRANTGAALTATWSNITFNCVAAVATPAANGAIVTTRTFNDCPLSNLTTSNNYPAQIQISDVMDTLCVGFANLHSWSFSADGGATAAVFNNDNNFHFGADFKIDGAGQGEGGLRLSPWYGQFVDGRFMANATTGEIACFGGALPFYSFTVNHGITYTKGTTIHLELTYTAHELIATDPATIQYRVVYNGNTYDSPVLPFGEQNEAECVHGLWGMLNDGRAGGYFQPRANTGAALAATWSNIEYATTEPSCLKPPDCSHAVACDSVLWPPDHKYHSIDICGVQGDSVTITVTGITQDEPVNARGDGNTCPDAQIVAGAASVRAERAGTLGLPGNGRVYAINFVASNAAGRCTGTVHVCVPHDLDHPTCIDDGQRYSSLGPCTNAGRSAPEAVSLEVGELSRSQAQFSFTLPHDGPIDLSVFDVAGRRVATIEHGQLSKGIYERAWNMAGAANGFYFVRLQAGGVAVTKTVISIR